MSYDEQLAAMREFLGGMRDFTSGDVSEEDYYPDDREPYRYGLLRVHVSHIDVPVVIESIASLAVRIGGYLTMNVHPDECWINVAVSRPLAEHECSVSA